MPIKKRILVVDDEEANLDVLQLFLDSLGYKTERASDGIEGLAKLNLGIDLVLTDLMMPGMDGFEFIKYIRDNSEYEHVPIIMLTSLTSKENSISAIEAGANDFISKPFNLMEIEVRIKSLLKIKEAQDALKLHKEKLEEDVEKRTVALRKSLEVMAEAQRETKQAYLDTIQRLSVAAEYRDENTAAHIQRLSSYCALLAQGLGLAPGEIDNLRYASPMHDVGKIGIPDSILLKPGKLNDEEWKVMKKHTTIGGQILGGSSSKLLQVGENIALTHHEKWDGSGYPKGLKGEEIHLFGRICAVADVFDALTSQRPYKEAFTNEKAFEIIKLNSDSHFDPKIVGHFFKNIDGVLKTQEKFGRGH